MAGTNPEYSAELAARIGAIYNEAADELSVIVARRVAGGGIDDGNHWAQLKLADISRLRSELSATMGKATPFAKQALKDTIRTAYMAGASEAGAITGDFFRSDPRTLAVLEREAMNMADDAHKAILRTTADAYRDIIADTTTRISLGTQTRQQATAKALQKFAKNGIKGFTDKAGRNWEIESYAEMASRTASGRAALQGGLDRIADNGMDLVIVSNAPEECSICRPWEGKILSISGNSRGGKVKGTVDQARAAGLFHANCRHHCTAYVEGLTDIPTNTADPEGDKIRTEHRAWERSVRKAKRQTQVLAKQISETRKAGQPVDPAVMAAYQRTKANQKAIMDDYLKFLADNNRKRLTYREVARGNVRFGPQDYIPLAKVPKAPTLGGMGAKAAERTAENWQETTSIKWGAVSKELRETYTKAAQDMINKYPVFAQHVTKFGRLTEHGVKDRTGMLAATAWRKRDLYDVTVGVANTRDMKRQLILQEAEGWMAAGTPKGMIDHEFGHVAEIVIEARHEKILMEEIAANLWTKLGKGEKTPAAVAKLIRESRLSVSRYANSHNSEFIAECWSAYHNGKATNKIVKIVGETIEKMLREAATK